MLKIPCSYVAGLCSMNRFKGKWETISALITRYNKHVMDLFLTPSEVQKINNKHFYVDSRKAAIVKQCLRGEDVHIPARMRNQVLGLVSEKRQNFENSHEFITKEFENFVMYGQTDGLYKKKWVLEYKTRMRYWIVPPPPHDVIQLGCYMIIKQMPGVLVQDLHGDLKESYWTLKDMEVYMKPHLKLLKEVVNEINDIFKGKISDKNRKLLRFCLLRG